MQRQAMNSLDDDDDEEDGALSAKLTSTTTTSIRKTFVFFLFVFVAVFVCAAYNYKPVRKRIIVPRIETTTMTATQFLHQLRLQETQLGISGAATEERLSARLFPDRDKPGVDSGRVVGKGSGQKDDHGTARGTVQSLTHIGGAENDTLIGLAPESLHGRWRIHPKILTWLRTKSVPLKALPLPEVEEYKRFRFRRCPTSNVLHNNSTFFQSRFAASVPLFLSANEILNQTSFDKLSVYNLPYGLKLRGKEEVFRKLARHRLFSSSNFFWQPKIFSASKPNSSIDSNSSTSLDTDSVSPASPRTGPPPPLPKPPPPACVSCAVVGGGGSLRNSSHGGAIDAHDLVFRVNVALTSGFEKDVGSKTDFYYSYPESFRKFAAYPNAFTNQRKDVQFIFSLYERYHPQMYSQILNGAGGYFSLPGVRRRLDRRKPFFRPGDVWFVHPDFHRYQVVRFVDTRKKPTSGFALLFVALHLCDRVSIFGFSYGGGKRLHYYDHRRPVESLKDHDVRKEYAVLEKLHRDGVIDWVR